MHVQTALASKRLRDLVTIQKWAEKSMRFGYQIEHTLEGWKCNTECLHCHKWFTQIIYPIVTPAGVQVELPMYCNLCKSKEVKSNER